MRGHRRFLDFIQRHRAAAWYLLIPMLLLSRPTWSWILIGAAVAASGLVLRAWASGCVRKNEELATEGPYAYVRNPLYLGSFMLGIGLSLSSGLPWFLAIFVLYYLSCYVPLMNVEDEGLRQRFLGRYEKYRQAVPAFIPRLSPFKKGAADRPFDWALYLRHREYWPALGWALAIAFLVAKLYYRSL